MTKAFQVAKWEYLERIKNKAYIFMTFIFPLLIIGIAILPAFFIDEEDVTTKVIGIVEKNFSIAQELEKYLIEFKTKNDQPAYILKKISFENFDVNKALETASKLVIDKYIDGFFYFEKISSDSFLVEYHTEKIASTKEKIRLEKTISQLITNEKLKTINLDPDLISKLTKSTPLKFVKISEKGKEQVDTEIVFLGTFFFILFLMISLLMAAGLLVRSLVEEKSNRIIEILLSSCTTNELMAGKILGSSALGLTQILVWIFLVLSIGGPMVLSYIQIQDLYFSLIYFFLGYVFYASLFIGLGSIGNNEQESQTIMSILSIVVMLPIFFAFPISENPESGFGIVLSYFPLTAAPTMMLRINMIDIPILEKIITFIVLLISIFGSIWFSGKIFRVAILSYGKIPNIYEILKWLKTQ